MTERWMSVPEVARMLGVTDKTVHTFLNSGQLVGYRIGRCFRIRIEDVGAYLELVKVKPGDLEHLLPHAYDGPRHNADIVDLRDRASAS